MLADFDSVVEAARCAAALRDAAAQTNQPLPDERRIAMRIGINLGDIIAEGGDVFGDGVNIAARLEALAEPGSIYVSGIVHDQVVDRIEFDFEDLGPESLRISAVRSTSTAWAARWTRSRKPRRRSPR